MPLPILVVLFVRGEKDHHVVIAIVVVVVRLRLAVKEQSSEPLRIDDQSFNQSTKAPASAHASFQLHPSTDIHYASKPTMPLSSRRFASPTLAASSPSAPAPAPRGRFPCQ